MWATLDQLNLNQQHYKNKNRRPVWLNNARIRLDTLHKLEINIIDAYEDGMAGWGEVKSIQKQVEKAEREYTRLYEKWNAGFHVPTVAEKTGAGSNGR